MKKLLFILVLLSSGFSLFGFKNPSPNSFSAYRVNNFCSENLGDYRYERVFIDGRWWIIVYDMDGNIVNIYEDEE